jgi:hypothetical protein
VKVNLPPASTTAVRVPSTCASPPLVTRCPSSIRGRSVDGSGLSACARFTPAVRAATAPSGEAPGGQVSVPSRLTTAVGIATGVVGAVGSGVGVATSVAAAVVVAVAVLVAVTKFVTVGELVTVLVAVTVFVSVLVTV